MICGRHLASAALGLCLMTPFHARAEPSIWQTARDPRWGRAHRVLVRAERALRAQVGDSASPGRQWMQRRRVISLLASREAGLPDPRLRFLLGKLVAEPPDENYVESRRWLEQALAEDPDSPLAGDACFGLAIACEKLGDGGCALAAYTRGLERVWAPDERAHFYANRADHYMQRGDLRAALGDYRQAITLGQEPLVLTLAYYGLGVALDRTGDLPAALAAMSTGTGAWPRAFSIGALDYPTVFFVPAYEIHYYKALVAMARAESARSDGADLERAPALTEAIGRWQQYLAGAEPARDRWVPNAKAHLRNLMRALEVIESSHPGAGRPRDQNPDNAQ